MAIASLKDMQLTSSFCTRFSDWQVWHTAVSVWGMLHTLVTYTWRATCHCGDDDGSSRMHTNTEAHPLDLTLIWKHYAQAFPDVAH